MREEIVNLDLSVPLRWKFLENYQDEINELLGCYLRDFSDATHVFNNIESVKYDLIKNEYLEEVHYIASISRFDENEVLIANLYYDILKFYLGCSAFAVNVNDSVLHARNLDWHSDSNALGRCSIIFDFQKNGKTLFKTVGWPGFIAALSGTKPGKFSVTLNAVSSKDKAQIALPVSFLLRDVLTSAESFAEAKIILEKQSIASDCLILLSGAVPDEIAVIERTPTRFATRIVTTAPFLAVTNDYKKLENETVSSILQSTSCGRYDRVMELLHKESPENTNDCLTILKDANVKMQITAQQMVFNNRTGEISLLIPT